MDKKPVSRGPGRRTAILARLLTLLSFFNFAGAHNGYTYWTQVSANLEQPPLRPVCKALGGALNPLEWRTGISKIVSKVHFKCGDCAVTAVADAAESYRLIKGLAAAAPRPKAAGIYNLRSATHAIPDLMKHSRSAIKKIGADGSIQKQSWKEPDKVDIWNKRRIPTNWAPARQNSSVGEEMVKGQRRLSPKPELMVWRAPAWMLWHFMLIRSPGAQGPEGDAFLKRGTGERS